MNEPHKFWDRPLIGPNVTPRLLMAFLVFIGLMIFAGWGRQYP